MSLVNQLDSEIMYDKIAKISKKLQNRCTDKKLDFFEFGFQIENIDQCKNDKIVYYQYDFSFHLSQLDAINALCKKKGKHLYVITDVFNTLTGYSNVTFTFMPELLTVYTQYSGNSKPQHQEKLFNCFIHRCDSVRQSWFYFLHLHNILDKGYVSFQLFQYDWYKELEGIDLFDYNHKHFSMNNLPHFNKAYHELRSLVPYCNFEDNGNLDYQVGTSKYSLVLDTYATKDSTDQQWIPGEKVFRALCNPTIPLLFHQTGMSEKLKSVGFNILQPPEVDKMDWITKQQYFLDILKNDSIHITSREIEDSVIHNRNVSQTLAKKLDENCQFEEFFSNIC